MFGGNFAPNGWAFCNGQLLPISENDVLFNLIGTLYGGDGETTFALPNLSSRFPIHQGQGQGLSATSMGETGGVESVTLTLAQIPAHSHLAQGSASPAMSANPELGVWAAWPDTPYSTAAPDTDLNPGVLSPSGGGQPHGNMPPFLCVNFIISLFGIYPSQ